MVSPSRDWNVENQFEFYGTMETFLAKYLKS